MNSTPTDEHAQPPVSTNTDQGFTIASEKILAKEFDGELTLINLDTGVYFAAGGPAVEIWGALSSGYKISATAKRLVTRYKVAEAEAIGQIVRIAALFVAYGLLVPSAASANVEDDLNYSPEPEDWSAPWVEDYGDMQDLLLLDPVHDVSGGSWPKVG